MAPKHAIGDSTDPEATFRPNLAPIQEAVTRFTPVKLSPHVAEPIIHLPLQEATNPLAIFSRFFPDWLIERIVDYTNKSGRIETALLFTTKGNSRLRHQVPWKDTSLAEIKTFLALKIYIQDHYETDIKWYWTSQSEEPIHKTFRAKMTYRRYEQLNRFFHIWDVDRGPGGPFDKCEELSNHLQAISLALWTPATNVAVDEAMIAFTGRAKDTLKIVNKPIDEGFKLWIIAQSGYFLSWLFHMPGENGGGIDRDAVPDLNPTACVVPTLVKRLPNWDEGRYHMFLDNLFTSSNLLDYLHSQRIGANGTAKPNSGLHKAIVNLSNSEKGTDNRANQWGTKLVRVVNGGKISQMGWKDNALVKYMSNAINCENMDLSKRRKPGKWSRKAKTARAVFSDDWSKILPVPEVNKAYQYHMGYVDQGDQLRAALDWRREVKNWRALFNGLLGIAIVNSYLLSYHSSAQSKYTSFTAFRMKLYKQLWKDPGRPNWAASEAILGKRKRLEMEGTWVPSWRSTRPSAASR